MLNRQMLQSCVRRGLGRLAPIAAVAAAALCALPTHVAAQTFPTQIGTEADCRGSGPFVDVIKDIRPWGVIGGSTSAPVDSAGWPTTDAESVPMDSRPIPAWAPPLDDPAAYQPD